MGHRYGRQFVCFLRAMSRRSAATTATSVHKLRRVSPLFLHAKGQRRMLRQRGRNKSLINTPTLLLYLYRCLRIPNDGLSFLLSLWPMLDITLFTCVYISAGRTELQCLKSQEWLHRLWKGFFLPSLCRSLTWKYNLSNQVQLQINNDHARCHPAPIIRTQTFMCLPVFGPVTSGGHSSLCSATFSTQKFIGPL